MIRECTQICENGRANDNVKKIKKSSRMHFSDRFVRSFICMLRKYFMHQIIKQTLKLTKINARWSKTRFNRKRRQQHRTYQHQTSKKKTSLGGLEYRAITPHWIWGWSFDVQSNDEVLWCCHQNLPSCNGVKNPPQRSEKKTPLLSNKWKNPS